MVHDQNLLGIVSTAAPLAADIFHNLALYLLSNTVSNLRHDCREKISFGIQVDLLVSVDGELIFTLAEHKYLNPGIVSSSS